MKRWMLGAVLLAVTATPAAARPSAPITFVGNGMGEVTFLRYSPSGKELVRVCRFGAVEMIATDRYDRIRSFEIGMRMVAYSPDGKRLATAEGTDGARVWDATLPGRSLPNPKDSEMPWSEIRVLDTPLKVLETQSSEGANSNVTRADKQRVLWADFSPDGARLLTVQASGHVKVWSTGTWALEAELPLSKAGLTAVFAPDGKTVLAGDVDGVLHEWDLAQKKELKTMRAPGAVTEVVVAPDGSTIATVQITSTGSDAPGAGSSVLFWDRDRRLVETKKGWSSVAISKDGKVMAIGGKRVEFLDPVSRKSLRTVELAPISMRESNPGLADAAEADMKIPVSVVALAFSPDGATLAAGCIDGSIRLIQVAP